MNPEPKPDYAATMKKELLQLIDELDIGPLQKKFMQSRWLDQLLWMDAASKKNQIYYYALRMACIIGGVMIPALVGVDMEGSLGTLIRMLTVVISLVVAVSAAIEEFFHFGERWRHYCRTAQVLKAEGWSYLQLGGSYQDTDSHAEAYAYFAGRVEEIIQKEVDLFVSKLSKEKEKKKE